MDWKQLYGSSELCSCLSEPYWHVRKRGKINLTVIVKHCIHFPPCAFLDLDSVGAELLASG